MGAVIFQGTTVKALKNIFVLGQGALDARFANLSADPTTTATLGSAGSIGFYLGTVYQKQDAGTTTAWKVINKIPGVLYYDDASWGLASSWTTGKNSTTFLSGGVIGGVHSRSTTSTDLNEGTAVWKYVANATPANSVGDYMAQAAWTVPNGRRGVQNYVAGSYAWSGTTNEAYLVVYDATTGASVAEWVLEPTAGAFREFSFPWFIPSSSSSLRYGFWIKALATGSSTLKWSPVVHTTATNANLSQPMTDRQFTLLSQAQNAMTDRDSYIRYNLSTASKSININPDTFFVFEDNAGDAGTRCRILRDCTIISTFSSEAQNSTGGQFYFYHRNSGGSTKNSVTTNTGTTSLNQANYVQMTTYAVAGDYLQILAGGQPLYNGADTARWSVYAEADSDAIVTPLKGQSILRVGANPATVYTSGGANQKVVYNTPLVDTTNSWNAASNRWIAPRAGIVNVSVNSRFDSTTGLFTRQVYIYKNGSTYKFAEGNGGAGLAEGLSLATVGMQVNAGDYIEIFVYQTSGVNQSFTSGNTFNSLEICYIDSAAAIAQPVDRVVYFKDHQANNTQGGSAAAGANTRRLNLQAGDKSFSSLAGNQITVSQGDYDLIAWAPAYQVDAHQIYLWNITTGAIAVDSDGNNVIGSSSYSSSADGVQTFSHMAARISLSTTTVFELRHNINVPRLNVGLGNNWNDGLSLNDVFATIIFKKIK